MQHWYRQRERARVAWRADPALCYQCGQKRADDRKACASCRAKENRRRKEQRQKQRQQQRRQSKRPKPPAPDPGNPCRRPDPHKSHFRCHRPCSPACATGAATGPVRPAVVSPAQPVSAHRPAATRPRPAGPIRPAGMAPPPSRKRARLSRIPRLSAPGPRQIAAKSLSKLQTVGDRQPARALAHLVRRARMGRAGTRI